MSWHADLTQLCHQIFGNTVIEDALAGNGAFFLIVKGGGIIFEILDKRPGFWSFEQNFGFAFIEAAAAIHTKIHVFTVRKVSKGYRAAAHLSYSKSGASKQWRQWLDSPEKS